jgi:hypothetical protein
LTTLWNTEEKFLDDLKLCLMVQKRLAQTKFDWGDKGHSYFITVLEYCWVALKPQKQKKRFPSGK